ncbi:hypothetical protein O9K51_07800 [Purpureocillium lavendulum]|uniref:Uncharacterized protein n=1 Tax=Purpureocillium lavendulum TaxID=1247861 RepID=A0AB34FMD5_9HYPO|nr:hypothetical protein O9K51_07800 [Purpureocillium lavendulum]
MSLPRRSSSSLKMLHKRIVTGEKTKKEFAASRFSAAEANVPNRERINVMFSSAAIQSANAPAETGQ